MDLVTAKIALGGDFGQVLVKHELTWPEIGVLQELHGDEAVHDIEKTSEIEDPRASSEKTRLVHRYTAEVVDKVYPGKNPQMEFTMPGGTTAATTIARPRTASKQKDD